VSTPLFTRLVSEGVAPYLLDTQYRMHPAISQLPSDLFYAGRIQDGITQEDRQAPEGFAWPRPEYPVAMLPVNHGEEVAEGNSKSNRAEAEAVVAVLQQLLWGGLQPEDVGVITPYAAQVRLLRGLLRDHATTFGKIVIEVSSVDGFQGREKEVIVFSCVRANVQGSLGFLSDARRVNVSLTRAKRGLVVVGHPPTLGQEIGTWARWLGWARAHGLVIGEEPTGFYDANEVRSASFSLMASQGAILASYAPETAASSLSLENFQPPIEITSELLQAQELMQQQAQQHAELEAQMLFQHHQAQLHAQMQAQQQQPQQRGRQHGQQRQQQQHGQQRQQQQYRQQQQQQRFRQQHQPMSQHHRSQQRQQQQQRQRQQQQRQARQQGQVVRQQSQQHFGTQPLGRAPSAQHQQKGDHRRHISSNEQTQYVQLQPHLVLSQSQPQMAQQLHFVHEQPLPDFLAQQPQAHHQQLQPQPLHHILHEPSTQVQSMQPLTLQQRQMQHVQQVQHPQMQPIWF